MSAAASRGAAARRDRLRSALTSGATSASWYTEVMLPAVVAEAGVEIRRALEGDLPGRLRGLVLFGSVARGTAHEESDVDLLVLVDRLATGERARIIDRVATIGFERNLRIVPIVLTDDKWTELSRRELAFPREVARDGVAL